MAGRGPQTFKKRQKEQQRKEKQQDKLAKKLQRKEGGGLPEIEEVEEEEAWDGKTGLPVFAERELPAEAESEHPKSDREAQQ